MVKLNLIQNASIDKKKVLCRLDLNVPMIAGKITDESRIDAALPTIRYLAERAKVVVLCSHLGRPKGGPSPAFSLEAVGESLARKLGLDVVFVADYASEPVEQIFSQIDSGIILLENLRFHPGEKANDPAFVECLSSGFDVYVNDAFGTSHRADASVFGVAERFPKDKRFAGFLIQKEVEALNKLLHHPKAPFTVVMGGSKVSDKINVILSLMNTCNRILIGGAMAYTFLKYKGVSVGASKVEHDCIDVVEKIYAQAEKKNVRIELPVDHVAATEFKEDATAFETAELSPLLMGLDIGPQTRKNYARIIESSGTVFWNGPMGVFEWQAFSRGSYAVAKAMAETTSHTVVGGGDSVSALNQSGFTDKIDHISTGGGASLEYLEGRSLPGLLVLSAY
jgi:phosphoglycerate kinase